MQVFDEFPPRRILLGALALFLIAEAGVVAVNSSPLIDYWGPQKLFDVNGEGTIPAWLSSAALLMIALGAAGCGSVEAAVRGRRRVAAGWFVFAGMFTLLSLDETSSLHELVGKYTAIHVGALDSLPGVYMWVVVLVPAAVVAAAAFVAWTSISIGWREPAARLCVAAIVVWMAVPVLEVLDPALGAPRWLIVLEETIEVVGEALMLAGVWTQLLVLQSRHLVTIRVLGREALGESTGADLDSERSRATIGAREDTPSADRRRTAGRRAA